MIVEDVGEEGSFALVIGVCVIFKRLAIWLYDHFQHLIFAHLFKFLVMNSGKEDSVIFQVCHQLEVCIRMAEIIKLPADLHFRCGFFAELLLYELVPHDHIVDHFPISWTSFIVHRPAAIHQLQLAVPYQFSNLFLLPIVLLLPPHRKELHLCLREFPRGIVQKRINH